MAEQIYQESNYRFTDPIRFFKANDPYYFEVDNIPLKQLQENCLWLKDQVRKDANRLTGVKRADIDELLPYATGADRLVRVKPGRYSARINDASTRTPLAYLRKVLGEAIDDLDAWAAVTPNPGAQVGNELLSAALDRFKQAVTENALGMNGLVERAFTWPVVNTDQVVNITGVDIDQSRSWLTYGGPEFNLPGGGASKSPFLITEAILWAKSEGANTDEFALPSYETTNSNYGWSKFPLTESYFIKAWRGVSRTAIVDVDDELTIQIPQFDPEDFSYTDANGNSVSVDNVQQRIDLVFIYSKPVDTSSVRIIRNGSLDRISKPTLGVVKGAGIRANFEAKISDLAAGYKEQTNDSILAAPGDQYNTDMGFTSTSANDIVTSVRGSFPAPDDLLNIAPLISQSLEDNAYELVGQSILPVAYVFVQGNSQVVLSSDVIDIRPLFRTAELTYNERAGLGAAFPQLSLANPAVGKSHLDYEINRLYNNLNSRIAANEEVNDARAQINTLATGYIFGGYNFGPEGALFDYWQGVFASDNNPDNDAITTIKNHITSTYAFGSGLAQINVPDYPDWDLSQWCIQQDIEEKGFFPNDYINTFISGRSPRDVPDQSIVAGSNRGRVTPSENASPSGRCRNFINTFVYDAVANVYFHYVSKKIKFARPSWLADYNVDVSLINCLAQNHSGNTYNRTSTGCYFGTWVEKGFDEFTIYVAFTAETSNNPNPRFPAPYVTDQGVTVSERGGERFSGFIVPVGDILYSNTTSITDNRTSSRRQGYEGNPRVGKCTYPTVMWKITGVPEDDSSFLYGNLNGTNPTITLKGGQ
tara:strand:- start:3328 stop:5781 length:2454 start_codon:yes stop_codon:yes gene_type:complete